MGAMFPDRGHEQGQEGEGDDGQVIYLSYSRNEVRNQVNGGKGIKSRQSQEDKLASGEQARFSFPTRSCCLEPLGGMGILFFMEMQG